MRVKAIKTFLGKEGKVRMGNEIEVSEGRAKELMANGLVIMVPPRVKGKAEQEAPNNKAEGTAEQNKDEAEPPHQQEQEPEQHSAEEDAEVVEEEAQSKDPFEPSRGGRTGRGRQRSSSPAGRQQKTKTSTSRKIGKKSK